MEGKGGVGYCSGAEEHLPRCSRVSVCGQTCQTFFFFCYLLNSAFSGWRVLRIQHRNGLTSSQPSCHVNSADGEEIKGPSRQPFFHTLPILGDKLILINLIKDMWETQPYVEEISVECQPFSRFSLFRKQWCPACARPRARQLAINFCIVFFGTLITKSLPTVATDTLPSISDCHRVL